VEDGVKDFNQKLSGCIKIRPKNSQDKNWVEVIKDNGCYSWVGRHGTGRQPLSLSAGCYSKRTIQHEFIHSLGFYHEQSRPDRNEYVTINWNNIESENVGQFIRHKTSLTFNVPYDGKSIMHYTPRAFAINSFYTIESKMNNIPTSQLGSSRDLTDYDILKLKRMYQCTDGFVNCGKHQAGSCEECPQGNGKYWCNGDCRWIDDVKKCFPKQGRYDKWRKKPRGNH